MPSSTSTSALDAYFRAHGGPDAYEDEEEVTSAPSRIELPSTPETIQASLSQLEFQLASCNLHHTTAPLPPQPRAATIPVSPQQPQGRHRHAGTTGLVSDLLSDWQHLKLKHAQTLDTRPSTSSYAQQLQSNSRKPWASRRLSMQTGPAGMPWIHGPPRTAMSEPSGTQAMHATPLTGTSLLHPRIQSAMPLAPSPLVRHMAYQPDLLRSPLTAHAPSARHDVLVIKHAPSGREPLEQLSISMAHTLHEQRLQTGSMASSEQHGTCLLGMHATGASTPQGERPITQLHVSRTASMQRSKAVLEPWQGAVHSDDVPAQPGPGRHVTGLLSPPWQPGDSHTCAMPGIPGQDSYSANSFSLDGFSSREGGGSTIDYPPQHPTQRHQAGHATLQSAKRHAASTNLHASHRSDHSAHPNSTIDPSHTSHHLPHTNHHPGTNSHVPDANSLLIPSQLHPARQPTGTLQQPSQPTTSWRQPKQPAINHHQPSDHAAADADGPLWQAVQALLSDPHLAHKLIQHVAALTNGSVTSQPLHAHAGVLEPGRMGTAKGTPVAAAGLGNGGNANLPQAMAGKGNDHLHMVGHNGLRTPLACVSNLPSLATGIHGSRADSLSAARRSPPAVYCGGSAHQAWEQEGREADGTTPKGHLSDPMVSVHHQHLPSNAHCALPRSTPTPLIADEHKSFDGSLAGHQGVAHGVPQSGQQRGVPQCTTTGRQCGRNFGMLDARGYMMQENSVSRNSCTRGGVEVGGSGRWLADDRQQSLAGSQRWLPGRQASEMDNGWLPAGLENEPQLGLAGEVYVDDEGEQQWLAGAGEQLPAGGLMLEQPCTAGLPPLLAAKLQAHLERKARRAGRHRRLQAAASLGCASEAGKAELSHNDGLCVGGSDSSGDEV